jgi:hypothetical protein
MIAILILHQIDHIPFEFINKMILLLIQIPDVLKPLLNDPTSKGIIGEFDDPALNQLKYLLLMLIHSYLKDLLEDIVPELVLDQPNTILHKLLEHQLFVLVDGRLHPVLDRSGAVAVAGHLVQHGQHLLGVEQTVLAPVPGLVVHLVGHVHHCVGGEAVREVGLWVRARHGLRVLRVLVHVGVRRHHSVWLLLLLLWLLPLLGFLGHWLHQFLLRSVLVSVILIEKLLGEFLSVRVFTS